MQRYVVSTIIGLLIGLLAVWTVASFGLFEKTPWELPGQPCGPIGRSFEILEHKGIMIRFFFVLIDQGFRYIVISSAITFVIAKLGAVGKRSHLAWRIYATIVISLFASGAAAALLGFSAAAKESGVSPPLDRVLINGWFGTLLLFFAAWCSGFAPLFAISVYLISSSKRFAPAASQNVS